MRNLKLALRTLARTPIVSLVAILSLALGIGANTAIFSLFEQTLLRPLPVPGAEELVNLSANGPRSGSNSTSSAGNSQSVFSYPMYRDLERQQDGLSGLAAHRDFGANVAYQGQTASVQGMLVSGSYFPTLGLKPVSGRLLSPLDDQTPGAHRLVVLAHGYWKEKFNESAAIVGQSMLVNGIPMTVVGVAPQGFRGTSLGQPAGIFVPISMRETLVQGWKGLNDRRSYWVYVFGRLKPGISLETAQASLATRYLNIIRTVDLPLQKDMSEKTRARFINQKMILSAGARGQSSFHAQGRTPMVLLFSITGFVLLIACANIANLLLARSANRAREFSIRLSLGASRAQVMTQLLSESIVLAICAGIAGLFVAYATSLLILGFLPAGAEELFSPQLDPNTILFAAAVSICTGFLFGLFPAYHSTRIDLASAMKDQAGNLSSSGAANYFRRSLVTAQIALSLALLVSAGTFLKSLIQILQVDLGLRTRNVISFRISPDRNQYKPEVIRSLYDKAESRLAALPGAEGVAVSMVPLIAGNNWTNNVSVDGFEASADTDTNASFNRISAGFFRVFGVPLRQGREFTSSDSTASPKVAIVNEAFERKFGNRRSLVGRRMQLGSGGKNDIEIVGVVRDLKYSEVKDPAPATFYLPYRQDAEPGSMSLYVTTAVPFEQLAEPVRNLFREIDPNLPLEDFKSFETQVKENIGLDRMISTLAAAFALLATLLAAVGLYGVLAYTVARRTREIGIRMAIGADPASIRNLVMKEVLWMLLIGAVLGAPAGLSLMQFASELLYEVKGADIAVLSGSLVLLGVVSLLAGWLPARRAMTVEPLEALRYE